ncbi:MAG: hypothetical protein KAJ98_00125, partial [Spirochaetaceae bacterium]|nr:hypothetical protein [Spirochaetaceae bacterium]
MKKALFRVGLSVLLLMLAASGVMAQELYIGGYVRNNTGVFLRDTMELSQFVNTLDLKFGYYGDMSTMNAEVYLNVTDDIDELEVGVRELYMDLYFNSIDLRIGKQKIIWGKGDGVFITDVVSPLDLSEFLTQEFEEIRLGVTALKMDWYVSALTFELIWIPVFSPTIMPDADSPWNQKGMVPDTSTYEPGFTLDNSEGFAKVSYMGSVIDVELMGGYMWDDLATVNNVGPPPPLTAQYDRVGLLGGSFSTDISGVIFRGEGAYYMGRNFTVGAGPTFNGTVEKNFLHYMFGLDYATNGFIFG